MSKYDWSNIPKWVNWAFTCHDGQVWGSDNKPDSRDGFHGHPVEDTWEYLYMTDDVENWQDSLEERPNE